MFYLILIVQSDHGISSNASSSKKESSKSPTLRIGIVNVYCELVSVKLHGKNLEPRDRNLRNQLAAVMLEHLHDRNASVRSRVLQLQCGKIAYRKVHAVIHVQTACTACLWPC
ncbi:hypothetical protein M513_13688 [Trichuris suis]|uniref:Uncharacterized protein n=1 Tax=Trichuris suis TaxID=68888 RepID=A0A085LKD8_9BILA|nr:hypothetical protein M513_13688 [Trichuris suis]